MAKKPYHFTDRDPKVLCTNDNCSKVHGRDGLVKEPIKRNVISRMPDKTSFQCYPCKMYNSKGGKLSKKFKKSTT